MLVSHLCVRLKSVANDNSNKAFVAVKGLIPHLLTIRFRLLAIYKQLAERTNRSSPAVFPQTSFFTINATISLLSAAQQGFPAAAVFLSSPHKVKSRKWV